MKLSQIKPLFEDVISPSKDSNIMDFWHGGNLEIEQKVTKGGRTEYGPGLYLTTAYNVAKKYAKGSRKFYFISVEKGNDAENVSIPVEDVKEFVKFNVVPKVREKFLDYVEKRSSNGSIKASTIIILTVNFDAVKPSNMNNLRAFLVNHNVDYWIIDYPFEYNEKMMVLFNMNKMVSKRIVNPKDKIETFDLPSKF